MQQHTLAKVVREAFIGNKDNFAVRQVKSAWKKKEEEAAVLKRRTQRHQLNADTWSSWPCNQGDLAMLLMSIEQCSAAFANRLVISQLVDAYHNKFRVEVICQTFAR